MTKRCLALGIWRTHTSYNNSVKLTEEIGQFFLGTEVTCLLALVVVMFQRSTLVLSRRVLYVQVNDAQLQDVHKWKLLKRCLKSNAVPHPTT